jgi:hypothetical protein
MKVPRPSPNALSFPSESQRSSCREISILIDAMRFLIPLSGPRLL